MIALLAIAVLVGIYNFVDFGGTSSAARARNLRRSDAAEEIRRAASGR